MTKNEALKAAIDGKKVRNERWGPECYLCFKEDQFFVIGPSAPEGNSLRSNGLAYSTGNWQIVPEYVDFATAWKAYEEGKEIVSVSHNNIKRRYGTYVNDKNVRFLPEEIRGKWRISEDE